MKAAVSKTIGKYGTEIWVHTGQHYEENMSDVFFNELNIPFPNYNLNVGSDSHAVQTANMMCRLEPILFVERPDYVLVYGDTNTTLAAALTASKIHIPIVHIEAGLRSFNKRMPEEQNRFLTDHLSKYLFCSTNVAVENLKNENIVDHVYEIGDVMCGASLFYKK